jgi:ATP-dependent exoDNAse (exonuclease V) beta subunit
MIMASAGSGKTWRLSRRLVRLILAGEAPETLVALTFTRKAAGEFFDAVLGCLAEAACDPQAARRLSRELGGGPDRPEAFVQPLRRLTSILHRLQFTTIDSFFHRIITGFPFELGLSGSFSLMDGFAASRARAEVLEDLLRRDAPGVAARRQFLESFKLATFGEERKFAAREVVDFADRLYPLYLDCPEPEAWAGAACPVWPADEIAGDAARHMDTILGWLPAAGADPTRIDVWTEAEDFLRDWQPGAVPPRPSAQTIFNNIVEAYETVSGSVGPFNLKGKKINPGPELGADLGALVRLWVGRDLRVRLQRTRGIARILQAYHASYDLRVRRTGRLVFDDLPRIIGSSSSGGLGRLDLDYRLDARFSHWLLDEFQDTSRAQWVVLENLVDEALQDPEERRTFFCVGDVKQSIYGWRGGDHRLFGELQAKYGGKIATENLTLTYRCSGAVVDLVNTVMGHPVLEQRLPDAGKEWRAGWQVHQSARPDTGVAAYLEAEDGETEGVPERHRLIADLIVEADPVARGWTCAVLTFSNKEAAAIADVLRSATGRPVILEGEIRPALDNSLGLGLLAWARALAHPMDTLAEGWMRASPGGPWLRAQEDWRRDAFSQIHARGVEEAARTWLDALAPVDTLDAFLTLRRRQLLQALRLFGAGGDRDPQALEDYLRQHVLKAPDVPGAIQVMTIYKAKGLGFDLVIFTELVRRNHHINQRRDGPLVGRDASGRPLWICEAPPKNFIRTIPEFQEVARKAEQENAYEQLCLLYVALTRARHALYVVGEAQLADKESVHMQHLVRDALADRHGGPLRCGVEARALFGREEDGHASAVEDSLPWSAPILDFEVPFSALEGARPPSSVRDSGGGRAYDPQERASRDWGTRVHEAMAAIERATEPALKALESGDGNDIPARLEAVACARTAALHPVFQPDREVVIWRERAFHVALEDGLVSGVFDRVLLWPDEGGGWRRAEVIDFKTDRIEPLELVLLVERHRAQMLRYRAALARLLDLDPVAVRCWIVSTHLRDRTEVK